MAKGSDVRLKVLKLVDVAPNRYRRRRVVSQALTLTALIGVPLMGIARVDLWGGGHLLLGSPATFKQALGGVIVGIAAMYVVTFLSNLCAGRLFCGWGCPVGQVSRFGERIDMPGLSGRKKLIVYLEGAAYSVAFVVSVMCWWVDPAVFVRGSPRAIGVAGVVLAAGVVGAMVHGFYWRWSFCKDACPIGLYYSFVSPARYFGVHFRNAERACVECDACDHVCPVGLTPRDLTSPITDRRGVSLMDAPGHNHCLECGDCVIACERMVSLASKRSGGKAAPLKLGWFLGQQSDGPVEQKNPRGAHEKNLEINVVRQV